VKPPEIDGDYVTVEFGYGGPAAKINPKTGESTDAYALFVHENLQAHHKVGQALYLGQPFIEAEDGMGARIAAGMASDLQGSSASVSVETQTDEGPSQQ